jgi:ethanolamine utilization microcompartment shell protein EutS
VNQDEKLKSESIDDNLPNRRDFLKKATVAATIMALSPTFSSLIASDTIKKNLAKGKMKFFIDTHDKNSGTFPAEITPKQMEGFYKKYEDACEEEGVVSLRIHVGFEDGKAYCFNMAPNAKAVENVHKKVGLPFETITEVTTITPADLALLS